MNVYRFIYGNKVEFVVGASHEMALSHWRRESENYEGKEPDSVQLLGKAILPSGSQQPDSRITPYGCVYCEAGPGDPHRDGCIVWARFW